MSEIQTAAALIPPGATLPELARAAAGCTACDLHRTGTQTVFGEGPAGAEFVLVGEQPGDVEDREGRPFVGPAGRELDRALEATGLDTAAHYRTNAVKHFKWRERRGKRRIHESPNRVEIRACLPWLEAELAQTRPAVVVPLGATAAQALLGWDLRITVARGRLHVGPEGIPAIPTVHPSSVLRVRGTADRQAARAAFERDLAAIATVVEHGPRPVLEAATVPELRELAATLGVPAGSRMRKRDLVETLLAGFSERAGPASSRPASSRGSTRGGPG